MKILSICLNNLASLANTHIIDFTAEPLASAGLFAITGPTGAGKSTILDALCLALYGRTPRLTAERSAVNNNIGNETISINDPRTILRRGCGCGWAETKFIAVDGQIYISRLTIRRARNSADGTLQNIEFDAKNAITNEPLQGTKTQIMAKVEELVGLNYQQFTRTVLLAQNDFASFLQSDSKTKAELLEKLTDTDIYSKISTHIFNTNRDIQNRVKMLEDSLGDITIMTDDELEELISTNQKLIGKSAELQNISNNILQKISWINELEQLQERLNKAIEEYDNCSLIYNQANDRRLRINDIDNTQPARDFLTKIDLAKKQLQSNKEQKETFDNNIKNANEDLEKIKQEAEKAKQELDTQKETNKTVDAQLKEARNLDTKISSENKTCNNLMAEAAKAKEEQEKSQKEIDNAKNQLLETEKEIDKTDQWLNKNKHLKQLFENSQTIISTLNQANETLKSNKALTEEITKLNAEISTTQEQLKVCNENLEKHNTSAQNATIKRNTIIDKLAKTNIEKTKRGKDELSKLLITYTNASHIAASINKSQESVKQSTDQIQKLYNETQSLIEEQKNVEKQKVDDEISAKKSNELLQNARHFASESIESLRQLLRAEEPCPVCGSTNHPFAQKAVEDIVGKYVAENEAAQDKLNKTNNRLLEIKNNIKGNDEISNFNKTQLEKESKNIGEQTQLFEQLGIELTIDEDICKKKCNEISKQLEEIQPIIDNISKKERLRDKLTAEIEKIQKEIQKISPVKESHTNLMAKNNTLLKEKERQLAENKRQNEDRLEKISPFFSNKDWRDSWIENPEHFCDLLKKSSDDFSEKSERLTHLQNSIIELKANENNYREKLNRDKKITTEANDRLSKQQEVLEKLKEARLLIFNGQEADKVEEEHKKLLNTKEDNYQKLQSNLSDINAKIEKQIGIKTQIDKNIGTFSEQLSNANDDIEAWLANFNSNNNRQITRRELEELLTTDNELVDFERKALKNIDENLTKSLTNKSSIQQSIDAHHSKPVKADSDKASLETQQLENQKELETAKEQQISINTQIAQQQQNRTLFADKRQEIEAAQKEASRWKILCDIAGSAQGDLFRQIAQGYTLQLVLQYANQHLHTLSKRYSLKQIPDSMNIKVIDHDMCDEERPVNSLSGGESFLVSLALALGLSSLSGSNLNVESLFIDEGFGALDSQSLDMAMQALERLQMQGKKIGVISHVGEMQERISTKIVIKKSGQGRSQIMTV